MSLQELFTMIVRLISVLVCCSTALANDWPRFRGPLGRGLHEDDSASARVPTKWSKTENIDWATPIPGLGWSSPVVHGDRYALHDKGFFAAFDAKTGEQIYRKRIARGAGAFSASPWAVGDKIFWISEDGETFVDATPAVAHGGHFIRTASKLYRVSHTASETTFRPPPFQIADGFEIELVAAPPLV